MTYPDGLCEKLDKWGQSDDNHFRDWRKSARESFAFVASDQWSRTERGDAEEGGRLISTMNRIGPMINAVAGAEIIDRQQVQYVPRTIEDGSVNEILSMGAEWIRDQTMADREESDAFRDVLICGYGYTETRMDYDDDPEGRVIIERVDPLEVTPDGTARKSNLLDARRIRRKRRISIDEFEQQWPDATLEKAEAQRGKSSSRRPQNAYQSDDWESDIPVGDDQVEITEWQWFEFETIYLVVNPVDNALAELTVDDYEEGIKQGFVQEDASVKQRRKVFYRAVKCGSQILDYGKLPDGEFTIKTITGERDRNKGTFFGIVEAMKDPQRFANLFFSMLHHIIRTNAKGGIMAEQDAFIDPKQAQESWARSDSITWMRPGAISKVRDKPAPDVPPQIAQLLQVAITGIRDSSGINEEMLGLVERNQPGVLEHQRKQAAYAILANYYDSLRFYRKAQGGLLLKYIQKYLPDGYLVRIVGKDGDPRYVPLAKQPDTMRFDVIVDDAPSGPNQKEKVWSLVNNMQGVLAQAGPEIWAEIIEYSPFPDKVNQSLKKVFESQVQQPGQQPDPASIIEAQSKMARDQAAAAKDASIARQNDLESAFMMRRAAQVIPFPQGA